MKRIIWILLILLLAGCVKRPEEEVTIVPEDKGEQLMELDKLDVSLDRSFKNLYVKWNKTEDVLPIIERLNMSEKVKIELADDLLIVE